MQLGGPDDGEDAVYGYDFRTSFLMDLLRVTWKTRDISELRYFSMADLRGICISYLKGRKQPEVTVNFTNQDELCLIARPAEEFLRFLDERSHLLIKLGREPTIAGVHHKFLHCRHADKMDFTVIESIERDNASMIWLIPRAEIIRFAWWLGSDNETASHSVYLKDDMQPAQRFRKETAQALIAWINKSSIRTETL